MLHWGRRRAVARAAPEHAVESQRWKDARTRLLSMQSQRNAFLATQSRVRSPDSSWREVVASRPRVCIPSAASYGLPRAFISLLALPSFSPPRSPVSVVDGEDPGHLESPARNLG